MYDAENVEFKFSRLRRHLKKAMYLEIYFKMKKNNEMVICLPQ